MTLTLTTTVEDARETPPKTTYRSPITLRVVRKSTEGTFLEWVAGKTSAEGVSETGGRILEMADRVFEDLHLIVHLSPDGRLRGIQNEEELNAKIKEFVELLVPQATAKIADATERQRTADWMRSVLTPRSLLSAARREMDLFFGVSGLRLEVGKPLRVKSSRASPFSTVGAQDSELEIVPAAPDPSTGEQRVAFSQQWDRTYTAGFAPLSLRSTDAGEFLLDSSGRVKQVRYVLTLRQNDEVVRVETTEITAR